MACLVAVPQVLVPDSPGPLLPDQNLAGRSCHRSFAHAAATCRLLSLMFRRAASWPPTRKDTHDYQLSRLRELQASRGEAVPTNVQCPFKVVNVARRGRPSSSRCAGVSRPWRRAGCPGAAPPASRQGSGACQLARRRDRRARRRSRTTDDNQVDAADAELRPDCKIVSPMKAAVRIRKSTAMCACWWSCRPSAARPDRLYSSGFGINRCDRL
jgi:hypothetical protein